MTTTTLETFEQAGLDALVRAGEAKQWFHGHFGAAMIAGARLLGEPDLPGPAALALSQRLDDMLRANQDWYRPLEEPSRSSCEPRAWLDRLRADAGVLRGTGHATIYGATALYVLDRHPERTTTRVLDGLIALHESAREDECRRYYGVSDYFEWVDRELATANDSEGSSIQAFRRAVDSLDHLVADRTIEGRRYFLTGEKIHLVTHAHAIATLEALGHLDIAQEALRAQRCLEKLVAVSDVLAATPVDPIETSPYDAAFWAQDGVDPAHVIKLAEAFVAERSRLTEEEGEAMVRRMGSVWPMFGLR